MRLGPHLLRTVGRIQFVAPVGLMWLVSLRTAGEHLLMFLSLFRAHLFRSHPLRTAAFWSMQIQLIRELNYRCIIHLAHEVAQDHTGDILPSSFALLSPEGRWLNMACTPRGRKPWVHLRILPATVAIVMNYINWIHTFHKMWLFNDFIELMKLFLGTRCYHQNLIQKKQQWKKLLILSHSVLH